MKKLAIVLAGLLTAVSWQSATSAGPSDEIVVVVNKANPAKTVGREELRPIFQTTKTQWGDGTSATPVNLAEENTVRQGFDAAVLGLDPDRVARYWVDRKIRGGERPPRKVSSPAAVIRAVSGDKGGVGYVLASEANDSVKIVARIRGGQVTAP